MWVQLAGDTLMLGIIDGDPLLYMACTAKWKYRYEQKVTTLDKDGHVVPFEIPEGLQEKYYQDAWNKFHDLLEKFTNTCFCDYYIMAVGAGPNFRDIVYPRYKWRRREQQKKHPDPYIPRLRQAVIDEGIAIPAVGMEADDLVRIWAEEARTAGEDFCILRVDKDLAMIPGTHYDMLHEQVIHIDELEAKRNFYQQLLSGDPTDSIPGLPKVGPVKAKKALASCESEEEMQNTVVAMYISIYDDDWHDQLLSNGKLIYILEKPYEYFSIKDWPIVKELLS